jgi:type III secretory pathway lipoprotein EscJ
MFSLLYCKSLFYAMQQREERSLAAWLLQNGVETKTKKKGLETLHLSIDAPHLVLAIKQL